MQPPSALSVGGRSTTVRINGNKALVSGGGAGCVPAYSYCDKNVTTSSALTIAGGYGESVGSSGYVTYHTHTAIPIVTSGCYNVHHHDPDTKHGCYKCECKFDPVTGAEIKHKHTLTCKKPSGASLRCGYVSGSIVSQVLANPGTCYTAYPSSTVQQLNSLHNYMTVELIPQNNLEAYNVPVRYLNYLDAKVSLLILEDTVVYYVR